MINKNSRKIRIAYLVDTISTDRAGTEKQLIGLIERLNKEDFEPYLISLSASRWLRKNVLPCESLTLGYKGFIKLNSTAVIGQLVKLIEDYRFHIVHTFFKDSIFVGVAAKLLSKSKPALLSSRRDLGLGSDELWYHKLYRTVFPLLNHLFNGVVTNSEVIRDWVIQEEKLPRRKIKVIYNGIELPKGQIENPPIFDTYHARLWVGIVANLKPIKRVDVFIRAIAHLKKNSGLDFRAIILGDGYESDRLKELTKTVGVADIVHFMGSVQNVTDYLQKMDIAVLCSDREGLSNAILEYMACGLPVVATAVGGNTELVDSTNGICVPPANYIALANAIKKLAESENLGKEMGKNSLQKVKQHYTWDKIIPRWEDYYRGFLCRRNH